MLTTAIGYFFPPFSGGLTIGSVAFISVLNWFIVAVVNHGVEEASILNAIVMTCKLVPIFIFIATMLLVFDFGVFTADFWGMLYNNMVAMGQAGADALSLGSVGTQIINCCGYQILEW